MTNQETNAPPNGAPSQGEPAPGTTIERYTPRALSQRDPAALARAAGSSGYWPHIKNANQAYIIMAAGEELGLSPLASFQGITLIEGQVGYRANVLNALLAKHEHYGYKIIERKDDRCTLQFTIDGNPIVDGEEGKVTFTLEDAKAAALVKPKSNWEKWGRRMCFWRCLTEGIGIYFPDLTLGTPVYTDEEIREVITVEAQVETEPTTPPVPEAPTLPAETVGQLVKGLEIAGPELGGVTPLDGLNVLLGSVGIDAFDYADDYGPQFSKLTEEQAAAVLAEFAAVVDRSSASEEGEEVDAEIVASIDQEDETDVDA